MTEHLTDADIDAIVAAMLARARVAGQTIDEFIDTEYRRVTPPWRRLGHWLQRRWPR